MGLRAGVVRNIAETAARNRESVFNLDSWGKYRQMGTPVEQAVGRTIADYIGDFTRHVLWSHNHPLQITSDTGRRIATKAGIKSPLTQAMYGLGLTTAVDLMANNTNFSNLAQGGRALGYQAVLPSEADPRETTNIPLELTTRYLFGRTGRLLPWGQFKEERPDISQEQYNAYKDYIRGETPDLLGLQNVPSLAGVIAGAVAGKVLGKGRITPMIYGAALGGLGTGESAKFIADQGIIKGTWSGIDGPEVRFGGYRLPVAAALGGVFVAKGLSRLANKRTPVEAPPSGGNWNPSSSGGRAGK